MDDHRVCYFLLDHLGLLYGFLDDLGTIAACMLVGYWLIHKGILHVPFMYVSSAKSPYTYYKGVIYTR